MAVALREVNKLRRLSLEKVHANRLLSSTSVVVNEPFVSVHKLEMATTNC